MISNGTCKANVHIAGQGRQAQGRWMKGSLRSGMPRVSYTPARGQAKVSVLASSSASVLQSGART